MKQFVLILLLTLTAVGQGQNTPNWMPVPAQASFEQGRLTIDPSFSVATTGYNDARIRAAITRLYAHLSKQTGMPLRENKPLANRITLTIDCKHAGAPVQKLGEDESYRLRITPAEARLTAPNALGVLRGLATFLQLVEAGPAPQDGFGAPSVTIDDHPRFPWRGLSFDVCRHWMPVDVIQRNLDAMAAVKLNVLHWHLSDDQGFRVESKRFRSCTARLGWPVLHAGSESAQVSHTRASAASAWCRSSTCPAHTTAWFAGYPELGQRAGPYAIGTGLRHLRGRAGPHPRIRSTRFWMRFIGEMARPLPG